MHEEGFAATALRTTLLRGLGNRTSQPWSLLRHKERADPWVAQHRQRGTNAHTWKEISADESRVVHTDSLCSCAPHVANVAPSTRSHNVVGKWGG